MSPRPSRTVSGGEACFTDNFGIETRGTQQARLFTEQQVVLDDRTKAIGHIAKMCGGSQSHLLRCTDGFYVVKFPENPQGTRILINELICSNFARMLGLPTPICKVVEVSEQLILSSKMLTEWGRCSKPCVGGLCFGSRHPGNRTLIFTRLPKDRMRDIENLQDLAGVLLFDLWTSNQDPREMLFFRKPGEIKMRAHMIDSGYCFRGDKWAFHPDSYSVLHPSQHYFSWITGVDSFEPWLSRIEALEKSVIDGAWRLIPQAWYNETDFQRLKILLEQLDERRGHLRRIVLKLNRVEPQAFPLWQGFRECASP